MPLKSILEVEVDPNGEFAKFSKMFQEYKDALAKTPRSWDDATKSMDGSVAAFRELVELSKQRIAQQRTINAAETQARKELDEPERKRADAEKKIADEKERQVRAWNSLSKQSKVFAVNIGEATVSLLRWAGITSVLGGLIGAGGLYGIDRLAIAVGNQRRTGLGLGVTAGQQNSFGLNFGRVLENPEGLLGGVSEALRDPRKSVPFYSLGLNYKQEQARGTYGASVDVVEALKKLADKTPEAMLGAMFDARRLGDLGISQQDFLALKNTPKGEVDSYVRQAEADRRNLDLTQAQQRAWQDLQTTLGRAKISVEKSLIDGLTPLTPEIKELSETFSGLVKDFLASKEVRESLEDLNEVLKTISVWLKGDNLPWNGKGSQSGGPPGSSLDNILQLGKAAGLGGLAGRFLGGKWGGRLGALLGFGFEYGLQGADEFDEKHPWAKQLDQYFFGSGGGARAMPQSVFAGYRPFMPISYTPGSPGSPFFGGRAIPSAFSDLGRSQNEKLAHDFFRSQGWTEAQTAGLLGNARAESGFNPRAFNGEGGGEGAQGLFQWRGSRLAEFQKLFGHSLSQSTEMEQLLFAQYELTHGEKTAGDALRAMGRNPSAAADIINRLYERSATSSAPRAATAEQYAHKFTGQGAKVVIQNQTGGNVTTTVSQLSV